MRRRSLLALLILILLAGDAMAQVVPSIPWSVIGCGDGHAEVGGYVLDGTVGQPIVGQAYSAAYGLCAGFWCGTAAPPRIYLPLVLRSS